MNRSFFALTTFALSCFGAACTLPTDTPAPLEEGGANANDRTSGGTPGELLHTGAMTLATNGNVAVMQRNRVSVLFDVAKKEYTELAFQVDRAAFSKGSTVYFTKADGALLAYDLETHTTKWTMSTGSLPASLLAINADDSAIIVGTGLNVAVYEASNGALRGRYSLGMMPSFVSLVPNSNDALVVGDTSWVDHKPTTPVARIHLSDVSGATIGIPNCLAPISVLPDASRALLSPTFCEEGVESNPGDQWTNPDPVSIIDLDANGALHFVKNLPGFGPVALRPDGSLAVAYLDKARMDPAMFDDASQVPSASSPSFHLMSIDPKTLKFTLHGIGNALPRFALTRDGKGLLVDASIKVKTRIKLKASAKATSQVQIDPGGFSGAIGGSVDASAAVFQEKSPFGYFDLQSNVFTGFTGPQAGIDRFVQLADGRTVIALERRKDGLGGTPHRIDLVDKTVTSLSTPMGTGVRDLGLLPDGKTLLVRVRMAAAQKGTMLYSQEAAYFSADFSTILGGSVTFQESQPFAEVEPENSCPGGHDCW